MGFGSKDDNPGIFLQENSERHGCQARYPRITLPFSGDWRKLQRAGCTSFLKNQRRSIFDVFDIELLGNICFSLPRDVSIEGVGE